MTPWPQLPNFPRQSQIIATSPGGGDADWFFFVVADVLFLEDSYTSNLASPKMYPWHVAAQKVRNQSLFESSSSAKMQFSKVKHYMPKDIELILPG